MSRALLLALCLLAGCTQSEPLRVATPAPAPTPAPVTSSVLFIHANTPTEWTDWMDTGVYQKPDGTVAYVVSGSNITRVEYLKLAPPRLAHAEILRSPTRDEVYSGAFGEAYMAKRLEHVKEIGRIPGVIIIEPCYEDHDCATIDHGFPDNWTVLPCGPRSD